MKGSSNVRVECYAGYRGEETPRRFYYSERRVEVLKVVDRWLAPDHRYFKLQALDGTYILRHDMGAGNWDLALYAARPLEIDSGGMSRLEEGSGEE
ncbi:MAG: hypothetical protein OEM62_00635 [Acidobacteriota bacterium]|nr:hypothetical protein [Acidobacteriota bacterium]